MGRGRLFLDLTPLRSNRNYRLLWGGYLASNLGSQLTLVGVAYQVYRLTGSSLEVGLVSLAQLAPLVVGSFAGGALADHLDRRRMLLFSQLAMAMTSLGLGVNALQLHPALWPLFVLSALSAGFLGVDNPTRSSFLVDLIDRERLVSANALWQVLYQLAQIAGPAAAGLILARLGVAPVYFADAATFSVSTVSLLAIRHPSTRSRARSGARRLEAGAFLDGVRFLRRQPVLQAVFLVDLNAMVFGMPRALFPALGLGRFHGGPTAVGLLYSAPAVGALAGALLTGWASTVSRQGAAVLIAVAVWGSSIALFGLVPLFAPALVLLAVAGGADVVSAIFRSTMLQIESPPALIGRVQAVQSSVIAGGPRLGDLEAGAVAALFGPVVSVVSGGLACLAGLGVLMRARPQFARYRTHLVASPPAHGSSPRLGLSPEHDGMEG